jgi:hypothetical protein
VDLENLGYSVLELVEIGVNEVIIDAIIMRSSGAALSSYIVTEER